MRSVAATPISRDNSYKVVMVVRDPHLNSERYSILHRFVIVLDLNSNLTNISRGEVSLIFIGFI